MYVAPAPLDAETVGCIPSEDLGNKTDEGERNAHISAAGPDPGDCETIGFSQTDFHSPRWRFRCLDRTGHRQGRDDALIPT